MRRVVQFGCLALAAWALSVTRPAALAESANRGPIVLGNDLLEVEFDRQAGALRRLADATLSHEHVEPMASEASLWQLELRSGETPVVLPPLDAGDFRWEPLPGRPAGLRMTWAGFSRAAAVREVQVEVRLDDGTPLSDWNFSVVKAAEVTLDRIHFPRVRGIRQQENERLAVPAWTGQLSDQPRQLLTGSDQKGRRLEWSYPGHLSLQCAAWYRQDGPGVYLACDDSQAGRKTFAFWGDSGGNVHFEVVHEAESGAQGTDRFRLPYQVRVGTFVGDWFTAAERYRNWALKQPWALESRLRRGLVPRWILNTGVWVWNRGRSAGVLPPAVALQQELGLPVRVFWHWWHGCAYDVGFPEYFPPREGAESFRGALNEAHDSSLRAMVYMNQRLWGMSTRSWNEEGAAASAVKGLDGKIHPEVYNTFDPQPCAAMCLGTKFWREKYAGLAAQAIDLGVDGIYMDQACLSLSCYDATHGHPVGGGNYWIAGFRELAADIRRRAGPDREIALAGEGCGEPWLDSLDLMLALQVSQERYAAPGGGWETIPFFQAVYHSEAVLFGSYSSFATPPYDELWPKEFAPAEPLALLERKFARQFYLEQARAFVWGQQPMVANFAPRQLSERAAEMEYLIRLAKTRSASLEYLLHGTFLRPPALDVPHAAVDFSRVSIYAGRRGGQTVHQKQSPLALAGAWRAKDGQLGIALASIADEPLRLKLRLDPGSYALPPQSAVYRISHTGRDALGTVTAADPHVELELPPLAVCVLEFEAK